MAKNVIMNITIRANYLIKHTKTFISLILLAYLVGCSKPDTESPDQLIHHKVDSLLLEMTLEEKVGQMLNIGLPALLKGPFYTYRDTLIFDTVKVNELLVKYKAGSVQNLGNYPLSTNHWRKYIQYIQHVVKSNTRLGIPVLYGIDAVHGANYTEGSVMFPHQINLAAGFNTEYAKTVGEITAYELRASGIPWNYAPVLDVARHPMWGRIFESFGEDTYLTTQMGMAMLKGMQGHNTADKNHVVACAKHFLGYGASYNGKDRAPVIMPENYLRQVLLPPFKQAIDNGLLSIMVSSGAMNGVPSHIDKELLTGLLKDELGFKGVLISDWGDIDNLHSVHKVAKNEREAVKLSVLAGIDICMEPYDASFAKHLIDLVNNNEVPMSRINDAVTRILYLKYKAGIFDQLFYGETTYSNFGSKQSDSINRVIASESITLLKNENDFLPLSKHQKILVTGVAANSINYLNGGWSRTWAGQDTSYNDKDKLSIYQALKAATKSSNVVFAQGTGYTDGNYINQAIRKARGVDAIVVCVGEKPATEKPSDINELDLPEIQQKLVKELAKTGKPIVLIMVQGRPRIIREIEPLTQSIVMAYLPGNEGGLAIADVLFGDVNPSGKLPYTYPRYSGSLWTYDHLLSDERDVNFGLNGFTPQYEFGHGLSYTRFEYSDLTVDKDTVTEHQNVSISVRVTNSGRLAGKEAVLLFLSDEVATLSPPVKQLKRFDKIALKPGQYKTVTFTLNTHDLEFVNQENMWVSEEGAFTLMVGSESVKFYLKK